MQRTAAHIGAVVLLLLAFGYLYVSSVQAQVSSSTSTPTSETVASENIQPPTAPVGYTIEALSSPSDVIPGDFVVGPGKTELTINRGESKTVEIIVSNRTGVDREFRFEVEDATGSTDASQAVMLLGDDTGPNTLKDYIRLPQVIIELKHNERARIPVKVVIPPDAEPGGRYGSILVTTVTKNPIKNATPGTAPASAIISRIGTLFFITIPGDTLIDGQLQSFKTLPDKNVFAKGPINFQILFENKGNLHLNPYGEIRVSNFLSDEVGFVELDPWYALPHSLRSREVEWNREFLIGRYTATLALNRGYENKVDTASVTFWVLPWKVVASVFAGLFLFLFIMRFIIKNFEFRRKST